LEDLFPLFLSFSQFCLSTLSNSLLSWVLHTIYQQLGDLQVRLNAVVGRREMSTSEVEVSAKEKKKSKKDRDKRNETRANSDKDKEALEWAIRKSQKEDRKRAKERQKEEDEMAKVLEQSRLEAEVAAKELKSLSCTPGNPTPLLPLQRRGLVVCDVHGNMNISSSSRISLATPIAQAIAIEKLAEEHRKKKSHSLHFSPLDRSSESKDSRTPDALEKKS